MESGLCAVTAICFIIIYRTGARAHDTEALVGEDVTLLSGFSDFPTLDLQKLRVYWTRKLQDEAVHEVYKFERSSHTAIRPGSNMADSDLLKANFSLYIPRVQISDEGEYTCDVYVHGKRSKGVYTLLVSEKPHVEMADSLSVKVGSVRSVTCNLTQFYPEEVTIQWVKHSKCTGTRTSLDEDAYFEVPTENSDGTFNMASGLTVRPSSSEETGDEYFCIVSHRSLKTDIERSFTLTVGAWEIIKHNDTTEALVGEDVTLPCLLSGITTPLDLQRLRIYWSRKSQDEAIHEVYTFDRSSHTAIRPGSNMADSDLLNGDAGLYIPRVQISDEGEYTCHVFVYAEDGLAVHTLLVSDKPQVEMTDSLSVELGSERSVTCSVTQFYPEDVTIQWVKHSNCTGKQSSLDEDAYFEVPTENSDGTFEMASVLTVRPSSREETGDVYSCIVSHRSLKTDTERSFTLTVERLAPAILGLIILLLVLAAAAAAVLLYRRKRVYPARRGVIISLLVLAAAAAIAATALLLYKIESDSPARPVMISLWVLAAAAVAVVLWLFKREDDYAARLGTIISLLGLAVASAAAVAAVAAATVLFLYKKEILYPAMISVTFLSEPASFVLLFLLYKKKRDSPARHSIILFLWVLTAAAAAAAVAAAAAAPTALLLYKIKSDFTATHGVIISLLLLTVAATAVAGLLLLCRAGARIFVALAKTQFDPPPTGSADRRRSYLRAQEDPPATQIPLSTDEPVMEMIELRDREREEDDEPVMEMIELREEDDEPVMEMIELREKMVTSR